MKSRLLLACVLLLVASDAFACRCEERRLQDYFAAADVVVMARLQSSVQGDGERALSFRLLASPYKGVVDGNRLEVLTPASSASCGVAADIGAVYVVFAYPTEISPQALRVDTCSGTRVHLSADLAEPAGFVDVPARFVASQLNALFGLEVLGDVIANAPNEDDPANATYIGLLDLKALVHGGSTRMYSEQADTSRLIADVQDYSELVTREIGYEQPAAVVYAHVGDWYRLKTAGGSFGWVKAGEAGTFFAYDELPLRRLSYLTSAWSGLVWPDAGAGLPRRGRDTEPGNGDEQPAEVLESVRIGGVLWFRVNILDSDPCEGGTTAPSLSGWVPAYGRNGAPTVGYYSRGC